MNTQWVGTVPADRFDWVEFARAIPLLEDPALPMPSDVVVANGATFPSPLMAVFHRLSLARLELPVTLRLGEWAPARSLDPRTGHYSRQNGSLAFVWLGDAATERDRALATTATFWLDGYGYTLKPSEVVGPSGPDQTLRGLFPLPQSPPAPEDNVPPEAVMFRNLRTAGSWDAAVRLDQERAVVVWRGNTPCPRAEVTSFLSRVPARFELEGVVQPAHGTGGAPRFAMPLQVIGGDVVCGVFPCSYEPNEAMYIAVSDLVLGPIVRANLRILPRRRPDRRVVSFAEPRGTMLPRLLLITLVIAILVGMVLLHFRNCWRER